MAAAGAADADRWPSNLAPPSKTDSLAKWTEWWSKARPVVEPLLTQAQRADLPPLKTSKTRLTDAVDTSTSVVRIGLKKAVENANADASDGDASSDDETQWPADSAPPSKQQLAADWANWWIATRPKILTHLTAAQKNDIPAAQCSKRDITDAIDDKDSAVRIGLRALAAAAPPPQAAPQGPQQQSGSTGAGSSTTAPSTSPPGAGGAAVSPPILQPIINLDSSALGAAVAAAMAAAQNAAVAAAAPAPAPAAPKAKVLTGSDFHGVDEELFRAHPYHFDIERVQEILDSIVDESTESSRQRQLAREEMRAAVKSVKAPGVLTDAELDNLTMTATVKDCDISSISPSSDRKKLAVLISIMREIYRRDADTTTGDPSRITIRPADVRRGATETPMSAAPAVAEIIVDILDQIGREDYLAEARKLADEARSDVAKYVRQDAAKGKAYAMCPILRIMKLKFGGHRNWLGSRKPGWSPATPQDYMVGAAHTPWTVIDVRSDHTAALAKTVTRGALVACAASDPTGEVVGESLNAHREEMRQYVRVWKDKFVFEKSRKDAYEKIRQDNPANVRTAGGPSAAASAGTHLGKRQRGGARGRNAQNPRGIPASGAGAAAAAAAGTGAGAATAAAAAAGVGATPATGAAQPAGGPKFTACMWLKGGTKCKSVVPDHLVKTYGGSKDPLCAIHRKEYNGLIAAEKIATQKAIVDANPGVAGLTKALG